MIQKTPMLDDKHKVCDFFSSFLSRVTEQASSVPEQHSTENKLKAIKIMKQFFLVYLSLASVLCHPLNDLFLNVESQQKIIDVVFYKIGAYCEILR